MRGPRPFVQRVVWKYVNKGYNKAKKQIDDFSESQTEAADASGRMSDKAEDASQSAGSLGDRFKEMGGMAKAWIAGVAAAAFSALAGAMMEAFNSARQFQEEMVGVRKTAGLTNDEMSDLTDRLLGIEMELGVNRSDLAAIAEEAGRMGMSGSDNIATFTRTVAMMAESTTASASQAASGLAKISNSFDVPIENAEGLASMMNTLSNQTVATVSDITDAMVRVGSSAKNVGLAADEVAAINATLIDAGISSREVGTAMRNVFDRIISRSDALADQMGTTRREIVQTFQQDGMSALNEWLDALGEMDTVEQSTAIEDVVGEGTQSMAIRTLVNQTKQLATNVEDANAEMERGTSLQTEMTQHQKGVNRQFDLFTSKVGAFVTKQGARLLDWAEGILSVLNSWSATTDESTRNMNLSFAELSDLTDIREQIEAMRELEDDTDALRQAAENIPAAFRAISEFDPITGEIISFDVDASLRRVDSQIEEKKAELAEDRIPLLQEERELRDQIRGLEARINRFREQGMDASQFVSELREVNQEYNKLVESILAPIAETGELTAERVREALEASAEEATLPGGLIGDATEKRNIRFQIERLDQLVDRYNQVQAAAENAGDAIDDNGDGDDDPEPVEIEYEPIGDGLFSDAAMQELNEAFGRNMEEVVRIAQDQLQSSFEGIGQIVGDAWIGMEGEVFAGPMQEFNSIIGEYENRLSLLRVELQRGAISQEEFNRRAGAMADTFRQRLVEVVNQMKELGLITPEVAEKVVKGFETMNEGSDEASEATEDLGEVLQDVGGFVTGILDTADAFGDVSDEARQAAKGIGTMIDKAGRLISLADEAGGLGSLFSSASGVLSGAGAIAGIVGGAAQMFSGLFGSDEQEGKTRRELQKLSEQIRENTQAIKENTQALLEEAIVGEDIAPNELADARSMLESLEDELGYSFPIFGGGGNPTLQPEDERTARELLQDLEATDLPMFDGMLQAFEDNLEQVRAAPPPGGATESELLGIALQETLQPSAEAMEDVEENFGQFGDSMEGLLELLSIYRDDLEGEPGDILSILEDSLSMQPGGDGEGLFDPARFGMDDSMLGISRFLQDAMENENLDEAFDQLYGLITGDVSPDDLAQDSDFFGQGGIEGDTLTDMLGDQSIEDFRSLLEFLDQTLRDGDSGSAGSDINTSTQVQRTITEFQANELLSYQQEQVMAQRMMTRQLAAINAALGGDVVPDTLPARSSDTEATGGQSGGSSTVVRAQFDVTASMSAEETARKLQEAIDLVN